MSSLTRRDILALEDLFQMGQGLVLNFNDRTFGEFFTRHFDIDINGPKYRRPWVSKANTLRTFWEMEEDHLVGAVLLKLVEHAASEDEEAEKRCIGIANRLLAGQVNLDPVQEAAVKFNSAHIAAQINRMKQSVESDTALAIGTAKELVETCCKTILSEHEVELGKNPDMPKLVKEAMKALKLVPEDIPDAAKGRDTIEGLLRSLGNIPAQLVELRRLYGSGHGAHGKPRSLPPRHARLAVASCAAFVTFMFDTHQERKEKGSKS